MIAYVEGGGKFFMIFYGVGWDYSQEGLVVIWD